MGRPGTPSVRVDRDQGRHRCSIFGRDHRLGDERRRTVVWLSAGSMLFHWLRALHITSMQRRRACYLFEYSEM